MADIASDPRPMPLPDIDLADRGTLKLIIMLERGPIEAWTLEEDGE